MARGKLYKMKKDYKEFCIRRNLDFILKTEAT